MGFWSALGLAPSDSDKRLRELVNNSYKSVRVVGRGTVRIDPQEVRQSKQFQQAKERAKAIVEAQLAS